MPQLRYWSTFLIVLAVLATIVELAVRGLDVNAVAAAGLTLAVYSLAVVLDLAPPGRPGRLPEAGPLPLRRRAGDGAYDRGRRAGARIARGGRTVLALLVLAGLAPLGFVSTFDSGASSAERARASTNPDPSPQASLAGRWLLTDASPDGNSYSFVIALEEVEGHVAGGSDALSITGAHAARTASATYRQPDGSSGTFSWELQDDGSWAGAYHDAAGVGGKSTLVPSLAGRWQLTDTLASDAGTPFSFTVAISESGMKFRSGNTALAFTGERFGARASASFTQGSAAGTFAWLHQPDGSWLGTFTVNGAAAIHGSSRLTPIP